MADQRGDGSSYPKLWSLVTHMDQLEAEDLFQYVVTAALLTTYLERRTNFFDGYGNSETNK